MAPSQRLSATFAALADPTRRAILARPASGAASVTELAPPFAMSPPPISQHLRLLARAGLGGHDQARSDQALVVRAARLDDGGLRGRWPRGRRLSLGLARARRRRDGDPRRLPRGRPARADRPDGVVRDRLRPAGGRAA